MQTIKPPVGKITLLSSFILSVVTTTTLFGGKLDYDYALKWARQGDMEKSLQTLDMFYKENPQNKHLLYDYITVLGWANQDKEALSLAKSIDFDTAPRYALQNIAKSARNAKQFSYATKLYVKGAKRFPEQSDFYLGLGLTLNDMKRGELSKRVFQKAQEKFPDNLDIKFAQAASYEQYKNYFDAMAIYQNLLKYPKVYDKAVVKLVGTLRRQGMAFAAQKYVDENPKLFDAATKTSIKSDQATFKLRWGVNGYHKEDDKTDVKQALTKIQGVINELTDKKQDPVNNKRLQSAYFDKIVALGNLQKHSDVIAYYKAFRKLGVNPPSHVLNIVGNSYLSCKKPKLAQQILIKSLAQNPNDFKTKILLFRAYSDGYDMNKALALAKSMDKHELAKVWDKNHLQKIENPKKEEAALLKILACEYSGYMDCAQKELETMIEKAPLSQSYRSALAKLYFYRGWYNKADEQYQIINSNDPKDFDAKAGRIIIALERGEYQIAHKAIETLSCAYPNKKLGLNEIYKLWNRHNQSYFTIQSRFGKDPQESNIGTSNTYNIDAYYYASPINYNWQPFVFNNFAHTKFYKEKLNNERVGMGVTYTSKALEVTSKLAYNATVVEKLAPSIDATWKTNDYLSLNVGYAYFSKQTPLRAIMYGIRADSFHTGLTYRFNEVASTSLYYNLLDFSDDNKRDSLSLTHFQRLVYGPYYNLDAYVYAGAMKNSKENRVYYNPKKDAYISLEARNIWSLYTLYKFRIKQVVGLEIGSHWEDGYGSQMTGALNLQQQWQMDENLGFDFGYVRKRSAYDGEKEYASELFFNINGRF